jgi:two-component system phosphate regulon response regulator PhoB
MNMKKILVVDDQEHVRELVEVTLSTADYEIIQAATGEEALKAAKEHKPDLILMDVMMPGEIDGLEATRRIKDDPETKDCVVIMLTAKGQQADRDAGLKAGADDYFAKPFSPLELMKKVEEVLG